MNENAIVLNYFTLGKTNMLRVTKSTSSITHCINLDQLKKISTVIFVSQFAVEKEMGVKDIESLLKQRAITVSRHLGIMWRNELVFF